MWSFCIALPLLFYCSTLFLHVTCGYCSLSLYIILVIFSSLINLSRRLFTDHFFFIRLPVFSLYLTTFIYDVGGVKKDAKYIWIIWINRLKRKGGFQEMLRIMFSQDYISPYDDLLPRKIKLDTVECVNTFVILFCKRFNTCNHKLCMVSYLYFLHLYISYYLLAYILCSFFCLFGQVSKCSCFCIIFFK